MLYGGGPPALRGCNGRNELFAQQHRGGGGGGASGLQRQSWRLTMSATSCTAASVTSPPVSASISRLTALHAASATAGCLHPPPDINPRPGPRC